MSDTAHVRAAQQRFRETFQRLADEIKKLFGGREDVIHGVLTALFAGGHVLLEGVPGSDRRMLVQALGQSLGLQHGPVQITPEGMPADIVGTQVLAAGEQGALSLHFEPGPVHADTVLTDEINRATPETQSALLDAMQELQVTVGGTTRTLPQPFIVLASHNPIEREGIDPQARAQVDRFLFKLVVGGPKERTAVLSPSTGRVLPKLTAVATADEVLALRKLVRDVPVPEAARTRAEQLVMATRPGSPHASDLVNRHVLTGSSPRGAQALLFAGKVAALRDGRFAVAEDDVVAHAREALRHRVLLDNEGLGAGITTDQVVDDLLRAPI